MRKLIPNIFVCLVLVIGFSAVSFAGPPVDPTIGKTLDSGPDPVGLGKDSASTYKFTIEIDGGYSIDDVVKDVLPAEFDVGNTCTSGDTGACCIDDVDCGVIEEGICDGMTMSCTNAGALGDPCEVDDDCDVFGACDGDGYTASCGTVTIAEKNKPGDKLRPDHVEWELTGCSGGEQTLMICMNTDLNPGHGNKGEDFYEPTSCGPLVLNDGASFDEITFSESLVVATCEDETDMAGCVDDDDDFWSVDCGDCDDTNPAINPDALEVCDDGIDNDCDTLEDCFDPDCTTDPACN